jgi:hypothetical protein
MCRAFCYIFSDTKLIGCVRLVSFEFRAAFFRFFRWLVLLPGIIVESPRDLPYHHLYIYKD